MGSVWNCDQSQFNYEFYYDRTLSMKGERETVSTLQSYNSATHSYTIDVAISMDGRLADRLYICFQEPSGKFGPRVSRENRKTVPSKCLRRFTCEWEDDERTLERRFFCQS